MQAMAGVTPIKQDTMRVEVGGKADSDDNKARKQAAAVGTETVQNSPLSDMQALLNPVASEAVLSYKHPTLPIKTFNQLKQGNLRWFEAVDLHGASVDDARDGLLLLLNKARAANENVVKIMHGKGDALLKTCVNGWLRQLPEVLAFVSAPAKDGGTGAVLVLLKRNKPKA